MGESPSTPQKKGRVPWTSPDWGKWGAGVFATALQTKGLLSYLPLPSDLSHQRLFCPCLSKCKLLTGSLFFKMRQKTPVKPDLLCLLLSKSSELRKSHLVSLTCVVPSQRYFCACVWIYLKHFHALCPFSQVIQIVCSGNKLPHYSLFHESLSTKALNRQRFFYSHSSKISSDHQLKILMRIRPKMIFEEPHCLVAQSINIFPVTLFSDVPVK